MATYVNDLRLKEITTGDESGTWGTSTNTNLELIAEAFSYGTEVITTNADTHTTTIADGATDPGRSLYLKYTGTLDSACTITIGPNTVSKVWIIENGTSGSQNIIISQGSGATITIPAGDTKVVYSDGAGAGAAFVDAFASINVGALTGTSLDISGDIDVDGTTNLDVVDIDGAVDMASTLAVGGVVTANAGVVVDNFTLDGTTLALSSGDMTLDVAGDIILDADGGDIHFYDGGTAHGNFLLSGTDFTIGSSQNNGDLIFRGIDGGADVTALTLDMSEAGAATFNSSVRGTQLEAYKTNHGGDVSVAANQLGNAYENLASTASLILGATSTSTTNSTKIVADHSVGSIADHVQDLVFYPVGGSSNNFEAMRISSLGALTVKNVATGHTVFNENGVDADFRVESDSNANMLFVDAGNNQVGIGTGSPRATLEVSSGGGTHALGGSFVRLTSNAVVDILTVSAQSTNSGVAIYARLVAAGAVGNEAAVIEFWAALNRQSSGADTATAITPVVSKAIVGTAIGAGSLAWSGKTLQYTPAAGTNYVGYQMEIQIAIQDPATITILP
jgi:cytoskeletal protein CcmA (bactofilin family)